MSDLLDDLLSRVSSMPLADASALLADAAALTSNLRWTPLPGPQTEAYLSEADELFFGGSAGGGKTALACGLAINEHYQTLILRREREQVVDIFEQIGQILGTADGRNGQQLRWDVGDRTIRCGGCKTEDDMQKRKGRANDLYVFDEISDFLKSQYEFIIAWNRSSRPGQRCRVLATGNPPTTPEGLWVIERWAAWLDPRHPNPAKDGELRWYTTDKNGKEIEVDGPGPHRIEHEDGTEEELTARSRSFIRAGLKDNPYLRDTGYGRSLDALPAAIRAAYRDGRFDIALKDNPHQIIRTSWIIEAQKRWTAARPPGVPMCSMGVDVAQGGEDQTIIAARYGGWYAPLIVVPGKDTPNGASVVALIIAHRRNNALPVVDLGGGYGGATKEKLEENGLPCIGYKGAPDSTARSRCGNFGFSNKRTEAYWKFGEALDPDQEGGSDVQLPDNPRLVADLAAVTFAIKKGKSGLEIVAETKENVCAKLGRSPDAGDAVVMAWTAGPNSGTHGAEWVDKARMMRKPGGGYKVVMGHQAARRR